MWISGAQIGNIWDVKLMSLHQTVRTRILETCLSLQAQINLRGITN
jgi:hypothetical protein